MSSTPLNAPSYCHTCGSKMPARINQFLSSLRDSAIYRAPGWSRITTELARTA